MGDRGGVTQTGPQCDVQTEEVILSAVLYGPGGAALFADLKPILSSGDWYDPRHRVLWGTMGILAAKQKPINAPEVAAELHTAGHLNDAGGSPYLGRLDVAVPAVGDVMSLALRIAELGRKRRALTIIEEAAAHGRNGVTDVNAWLADVSKQLVDVAGKPEDKGPNFRVLGSAEIFAHLAPISWVIQGLDMCPGAPSLFAGYGYSGKSMALQAMALQISAGAPVWGSFTANQGKCIHFDYEQGEHLTRLRYQRIAYAFDITPQDLDDRLQLVCFPSFYLDQPETEGMLMKLCAGKTLAIFDSFRAACPSTDENSSEARVPLDVLGRVSERTGCSMAVIHHARKPNPNASTGARDSIRGSGALYDACASVFVLEGDPESPERTVHHVKARVSGKTQDPMTLRIEDTGETGPDGTGAGLRVSVTKAASADERETAAGKAKAEKIRVLVRDLFKSGKAKGGAGPIALAVGRGKSSVLDVLDLMQAEGEVTASGSGRNREYHYAW